MRTRCSPLAICAGANPCVVWAIAEGRSAAAEVDRYLTGYTNLVRSIG